VPLPDTETLTLDYLGQRPDILAARLRVESSAARVAVARAGFYPNLRLSLLAGLASSELDTLDSRDARFGAAGISLSLPIFRSAQLQGSYLARHAEQQQAIANYHQTVLEAIREWRTALRLQQQAAAQQSMLKAASSSAYAALEGAIERYRYGLGGLLEVLLAEDIQLASESQALQAANEQAIQRVRMIRALGGDVPAS
jgi:outer membrane protein TolC